MRKIPMTKELFLKDYLILSPTFLGVLFIGISVYFRFVENNLFGFYGLGSIGLLSLIFAVARFFILRKLFINGVEVNGRIIRVSFYRQSSRIVFEFDYDSSHIKTAWITVKNKLSRNMRNVSDIKCLVNPNRPKQAVILDLFEQ
ncbi:MAG: hypothetical protein K9L02_06305 [Acholeplasmataceae bacterium]|nr:hypothetical protein [Acholeplasmataceae bacterium]